MINKKGFISIVSAIAITLAIILVAGYLNVKQARSQVGGGTITPLPVRNFLGLTDTPDTYSGQANKVVSVNAGGTGLTFTAADGGGDALVANPLSQFAATTSLQLKDTISDETGSGALVFATSPVFTTPNIGSATGSISGNAGTSTALAANGSNCSSGSAPLGVDASGVVESCFDVWTEAENTAAGYTTLAAVAGVGYFDNLADFTGTLTDTKFCTYDQGSGEIDCNSDASGGTITGTDTHVLFFDGADNPAGDAGLTYNKTTDTLTAVTFVGALTGNASTASALAANPADCSSNQFANAIAASGALTCGAIGDSDVPNNITIDLATLATTVTISDAGGDTTTFPLLGIDATGSLGPRTDAGLTYQATTNALTATTFIGALTGNASTATALAADPADCSSNQFANAINASGTLTCGAIGDSDVPNNITIDLATLATTVTVADGGGDTTMSVGLFTDATGSLGAKTDTGLTYQATTNALTATTFIGALTGNASTATALAADPSDCATSTHFAVGIVASGVATCEAIADADVPNNITIDLATLASTVTVVDGTDATSFIGIYDSATGSLAPKTDGDLLYAADTGTLTTSIHVANTRFSPDADDGAVLGASGTAFSDLFLASGGVINWNAGNATLTHSAGLLTSNVDIVVPTEVYGSGWNGSNEVPTKDALYDKINTMPSGTPFVVQTVAYSSGTGSLSTIYLLTSNVDGSVIITARSDNNDTWLNRYVKDANTGNYYKTHGETAFPASAQIPKGLAVIGSNIYISYTLSGTNTLRRYDLADLTNGTNITFSGTSRSGVMWSDETSLYIYNGTSSQFDKFTISGTTATNAGAITYTSAGTPVSAVGNASNAWISDSTGTGAWNVRKYATTGGAVVSTTSPNFQIDTWPNGSKPNLFLGATSTLGFAWWHTLDTNAAVAGRAFQLRGITLP